VRIVWKHFPLEMHKDAYLAHLAAAAAGEQGKFWEFHDKIFGGQPKIQRDFLVSYAKEVGLDMKRFEEALAAARAKPLVEADLAEGRSLGLTGTPAFFVNGRFIAGARSFEDFAKLINEELTKRNLPIPAAARPTGM
jgi:protein-disulfide isomerase